MASQFFVERPSPGLKKFLARHPLPIQTQFSLAEAGCSVKEIEDSFEVRTVSTNWWRRFQGIHDREVVKETFFAVTRNDDGKQVGRESRLCPDGVGVEWRYAIKGQELWATTALPFGQRGFPVLDQKLADLPELVVGGDSIIPKEWISWENPLPCGCGADYGSEMTLFLSEVKEHLQKWLESHAS